MGTITTLLNRASTQPSATAVGQFALVPLSGFGFSAPYDPSGGRSVNATNRVNDSAKLNVGTLVLFPNSPSQRNRPVGEWANPSIRTSLFIAPIARMTGVQTMLSAPNGANGAALGMTIHKQIAWLTRFDNWGNGLTDLGQGSRFTLSPGVGSPHASIVSADWVDRRLGRADLGAQMLHFRMRGAYAVNLFEPGAAQNIKRVQQDVRDGWYGSAHPAIAHANSIFGMPKPKFATMTLNPTIDGMTTTSPLGRSDVTGTIWSGVYSVAGAKLDVLVSNLDSINHLVKLGKIDAYDVFVQKNSSNYTWDDGSLLSASRNALIEAGMHRLLQFDLVTTRVYSRSNYTGAYTTRTIWLLNRNYSVFSNSGDDDGSGTIEVTTTFGVLAATSSMLVICWRRRRVEPVTALARR